MKSTLEQLDLDFPRGEDDIPMTRMRLNEADFNAAIRQAIVNIPGAKDIIYGVFLNMKAVQQMMAFLYHVIRVETIKRADIYEKFFEAPFVKQYCDREGIEEATLEASRRRCPFLLNILDACGIIRAEGKNVVVQRLVLHESIVQFHDREDTVVLRNRIKSIIDAWPSKTELIDSDELVQLRELFGAEFLTDAYHLKELEILER